MSVTPAALSGSWVAGYCFLGNVVTMFPVPLLELTFPASGLSLGVDMEEFTSEPEKLLAGNRFRMQSQLRFDVEPGMKPTALDNGIWPDSLDCFEHTLLTITDNVVRCGDE